MIELKVQAIEAYLRRVYGDDARLVRAGDIGSLDAQGHEGVRLRQAPSCPFQGPAARFGRPCSR